MRYLFSDYVLDTQRQELHHAGELITLRRKVFQVLVYLVAHRERVVPKQELLEHLWPDQFVSDEALTSCVKALRQALGERGRTPRFVRTLHGQGYRFVAAVEEREPLPADGAPHALPLHRGEGTTPQVEVPSPPLAPPFAETGSTSVEALDGEHKPVTVLCGALAEALTLAVRLGPEAMHHLMRDVLALAQHTVQRYKGSIFQVSGEGTARRVLALSWRKGTLALVGLLLLLGGGVSVWQRAVRPSAPASVVPATQAPTVAVPETPSIVVLPFVNLSGDPEQEYFSDGITEDLTFRLSRLAGLSVISHHSAFTYKGKAVKVQEVSQELGVRYVLEGSVRKAGTRCGSRPS
jgi:DNA-binding winged helix-turn-helix (wHTH) protein